MDAFLIRGPSRLAGTVEASGAKNAALPAAAAALLTADPVVLENVPDVADIRTMGILLGQMGVSVARGEEGRLTLRADEVSSTEAPFDLVRTMRASILVLGPLLARFGEARVSLPGGCAIGVRPVDLHIAAMEAMGARVAVEKGYIHAHVSRVSTAAGRLTGAEITFPQPTVTMGNQKVPNDYRVGRFQQSQNLLTALGNPHLHPVALGVNVGDTFALEFVFEGEHGDRFAAGGGVFADLAGRHDLHQHTREDRGIGHKLLDNIQILLDLDRVFAGHN